MARVAAVQRSARRVVDDDDDGLGRLRAAAVDSRIRTTRARAWSADIGRLGTRRIGRNAPAVRVWTVHRRCRSPAGVAVPVWSDRERVNHRLKEMRMNSQLTVQLILGAK